MSVFSDFMDGLPDGPIGLAVSGGSDSLALLVLTVDWAKKCGRSVFVVTLDHGLREEAASEAEGVAEICAALGVSHDTLRWDGHHKGNTQDAARRVRQRLIGDWAKTHDLVAVATGHTRDDQAETFLLRLKRGSGVDGLSGMARCIEKDGVLWVRPLLHKRRDALRATLKDRGVAWFDDPSNGDNRYDRVKVRKALKIIQEVGISIDLLANTAERLQTTRAALEQLTLDVAHAVAEPREIGSVRVNVPALDLQSKEVQLRLLAHALRWVSGAEYRPRLNALKRVLAAIFDGQGCTLSGCLISTAKAGVIEVSREIAAVEVTDGRSGSFDTRWICDIAEGEWRTLGVEGLARFPNWRDTTEHRNSLLASPSLWNNNELKSAPFLVKSQFRKCRLRDGPKSFFDSILTH